MFVVPGMGPFADARFNSFKSLVDSGECDNIRIREGTDVVYTTLLAIDLHVCSRHVHVQCNAILCL